jgi:glycosyltransferase involved in cell wall biosynthesis
MHILLIPAMYPNSYNPVSNIFFQDQAEALAKYGHKVGVLAIIPITIRNIIKNKKIKLGIQIFQKNNVTTYIYLFFLPPRAKRLDQLARKILGLWLYKKYQIEFNKPDVLHVHVYKAAITAQIIAKRYHIPYVITEHNTSFYSKSLSKYEMCIADKAFNGSDANISVSNEFCKYLTLAYNVKVNFVPNVVDVDYFYPSRINNKNASEIYILNIQCQQVKPRFNN